MKPTLRVLSIVIAIAVSPLVAVPRADAGGGFSDCTVPASNPWNCMKIVSTASAVPFSGFLIAKQSPPFTGNVFELTMAITNSVTWFKPGAVVRVYGRQPPFSPARPSFSAS